MVGRPLGEQFRRRAPSAAGELRLRVRGLDVAPAPRQPAKLRDVGFELRAREVLGIGGLLGAGRSELLLHLFGAYGTRLAGTVELGGVPFDRPTPARALDAGLCLVSEDRRRYGLCVELGIDVNTTLSSLSRLHVGPCRPWIDRERERATVLAQLQALATKLSALDAPAGALSGGNQQKVVLAKALLTQPKVLLLDEPTRGIDVGAKREIYALIERLSERGMAVVLVSSELPELLALSDRIMMLHEGKVGGVLAREDASEERLLAAALGRLAPAINAGMPA
jgi:D-xylose transport system ATP-binding protein